jgi:TolA-binding protein
MSIAKNTEIMKKYAIMFGLMISSISFAQEGQELDDCAKYKSLYYQYLKQGMYKDAKLFWLEAYDFCATANNLDNKFFKNGKVIYVQLIRLADKADSLYYQGLSDSIGWIYEEGLSYIKEENWRYEYVNYLIRSQRKDKVLLIDSLMMNMKTSKEVPGAGVIENYFKWQLITLDNPVKPRPTNNQILQVYIDYSELCFKTYEADQEMSPYLDTDRRMRMYLKMLKASNEIALEQITELNKRFSLDADIKKKQLERNAELLEINDLTESKLYQEISRALLVLNPSADGYFRFANSLMQLKKYEDAILQFERTISLDGDSLYLDNSYYQITLANYLRKDYKRAFSVAKKVALVNKGKAYKLMGDCIALLADDCGNSTFERKANYWLANDYYQKAKALGEDVSASQYLKNAPSLTEIFDGGLAIGDKVFLSCWGESTEIR